MKTIKRIYVEKKKTYDTEAEHWLYDLKENLGIQSLTGVRFLNRYDVSGITDEEYRAARTTIFSEPPVDHVYDEEVPIDKDESVIAVEYLPGQYDQRADSAAQCIRIITRGKQPLITNARVFILKGHLSDEELLKIKNYLVNPVDSREALLSKPKSLEMKIETPRDVEILKGFIDLPAEGLEEFRVKRGLAMSYEDLEYCRGYFRDREKRNPSITEIKLLDTYWSDHCRHTTFETRLRKIEIEDSPFTAPIKKAFEKYLAAYKALYPEKAQDPDISLMNLARMSMKELREKGQSEDLEISEEVNACSITREVVVDGEKEEWLVMFKNETHNHPTEIEPYGGAATCLGGAIRDPLSGRAFVYQAMRVTGSGNPLRKISDTLPGKLPQRKITTEAAHGYSSYGNQVGVPTGQVAEIYHDGYIAKRMEVGAVIGAVPRKQVNRGKPLPGDVILLVGGRTGRDGIGGATGSSKTHTEDSIYTAGAEVQKGNAPEERKLQRLFRNPEACLMIKRSNDFGAGGVAVAIGELAGGLEIYLDNVPKKYEGLDGTELALSESQERMAVVVGVGDVERFKALAGEENLEIAEVARVTAGNRLKMYWREKAIVDIARDFIDTHGVRQEAEVKISAPLDKSFCGGPGPRGAGGHLSNLGDPFNKSFCGGPGGGFFKKSPLAAGGKEIWLENLKTLNTCSQRGLGERFDGTVGGGTVSMPFGGKYQNTPVEAMAAKIPVLHGETTTATLMSYGVNPYISGWSPFHGAIYAVVEAVVKIAAAGGEYRGIRVSLQEYFEKLGKDPIRWGKPFSALLGAYHALTELGIPSIGGKDSMSGTFRDLDVPPTVIAFAVTTVEVSRVVSPEFKRAGSEVVYVRQEWDESQVPRFDLLKRNCSIISEAIKAGKILAAQTIREGGIAAAVSKMAFGNKIGMRFTGEQEPEGLYQPEYGSFVLEVEAGADLSTLFKGMEYRELGKTLGEAVIEVNGEKIGIEEALAAWEATLEPIFPTRSRETGERPYTILYTERQSRRPAIKAARPRVLVPVFPGTNCEYETQAAFERAGAVAETLVFRNLTSRDIDESVKALKKKIQESQVVVFPGGFSAGDEPDGSGKFIAAVFRDPGLSEALMALLNKRDGLILGICNGFQVLLKLGLLPYGEIREMGEGSPTLTYNRIGRHMSKMVRTKVVSVLSPWFLRHEVGEIHTIPVSHGEGRFVAEAGVIRQLMEKGQVATQYVDMEGNPTMEVNYNINGSMNAIESISSPDGRVLGKMGHTERISAHTFLNIPGNKNQELFRSGVDYFS